MSKTARHVCGHCRDGDDRTACAGRRSREERSRRHAQKQNELTDVSAARRHYRYGYARHHYYRPLLQPWVLSAV